MCHAILIGYKLFNDVNYLEFFNQALLFEKNNYNEKINNWTDLREDDNTDNLSWCNGATGIGLARLKYIQFYTNDLIIEDISKAKNKIMSSLIQNSDVLCHGNFGSIDFLITYNKLKKDKECVDFLTSFYSVLKEKTNNKVKCNDKNNMLSLSLMTGITGIAYEVLRLENPDLPSVLLLETPIGYI